MEKERFLFLAKNYTSLTRDEATELISVQDEFPYSQVLHNLCSRAAQDCDLDSREKLLHTSAIYTTERTVLKSIMTALATARQVREETPTPVKETIAKEETLPKARVIEKAVVSSPPVSSSTLSGETLRNDLLIDLDRLKTAKAQFETTMANLNTGQNEAPVEETKKKVKKADGIEPVDNLIEEIKTKKKVKPEGPKQKEQIEIIENFIKTQPTITKNKLASQPVDGSDLAEKSLLFGDNIVSETLVEILLKQGKKDKAIEVLKKLIWKIPQKKAYFAAQIEELKK